jgi:hypothetical protein
MVLLEQVRVAAVETYMEEIAVKIRDGAILVQAVAVGSSVRH